MHHQSGAGRCTRSKKAQCHADGENNGHKKACFPEHFSSFFDVKKNVMQRDND
jgi:hypothetical protein